ncbi:MAG TPA: TonB-dependent receptor, partial [Blastocatellia bacterium]|nr:TonB-dependent receptor [Blastocatellia bacterium]
QQQTIAAGPFNNVRPVWPNVVTPTAQTCTGSLGTTNFPCFSGVRVFSRDYRNPRIYTTNVAFEQEIAPDWALYFDFTYSKGVFLTRFLNANRNAFFFPYLDETMVTSSVGKSLYRGFTTGIRKRFSKGFQLEANYVWSKDKDDDSNERDPFTDRSFDINNLQLDYSLSDRDIRHKFNLFAFFELPGKFQFAPRIQGRSAQPATPAVRTATNRNTLRKDNEFFTFDWQFSRVFDITETVQLIPQIEMFNTFNNDNLINSLSGAGNQNSLTAPSLFNFDGFLRQGVGDPRQLQLSVKLRF